MPKNIIFFFLLSSFNIQSPFPRGLNLWPVPPQSSSSYQKIFFEEGDFCWWGLFTLHVSSSLKETISTKFHYIFKWYRLTDVNQVVLWLWMATQRGHSLNVCEMVFQFFLIGSVCLQFLKRKTTLFFHCKQKTLTKKNSLPFFFSHLLFTDMIA